MNFKFLILDKLASIGECSLETLFGIFDIADAMMSTYPEAYRKLKRLPRQSRSQVQLIDRRKLQLKINLSSTLSRLKKEGIIANKKRGYWSLTKKGKQVAETNLLKIWEGKIKARLREKHQQNKKENKEEQILIVFDVPESMKSKRRWLRGILRALNFSPLQKSVWIGNTVLPQEFIEAIVKLDLIYFIEIFTVVKKGTIGMERI